MNAALPIRMVERPWGRESLPAPFVAPPGKKVGEVWFEPQPTLDALLVKYLFTSEALSVQVHPSDLDAPPGKRGKEECWYVIAAEPDAKLGIGFKAPIAPEAMRAAALDGSIEDLLEWHQAKAGDFFYIPAGTVHAIGSGLSLVEVQQNSDMTYRLYDYGRPRELHLDAGIAVANGMPYPRLLPCAVPASGAVSLVDGPHFRLDRLDGAPDAVTRTRYEGPLLVVPLDGEAEVDCQLVRAGECAVAAQIGDVGFVGRCLIAQPCG